MLTKQDRLRQVMFLLLLALLFTSCTVSTSSGKQQVFVEAPKYQQFGYPSIADLLTVERSVSIFYSYARETKFSKMLDISTENITVLAPTNKAVIALPRKPHHGPEEENIEKMPEISQADYDTLSRSNVENWVAAHIIPTSLSLEAKEETYETLLSGRSMSFALEHPSRESWARYVINGDIEVITMKQASNGVVYLIDGTSLY